MSDDIALVRSLYGDADPQNYIIPEQEIENYLIVANGDVLYAASLACGAIASSELYLQKVLRTDDLTINGAAVAAEWRLRAQNLYEQSRQVSADRRDLDIVFFPDQTPFTKVGQKVEGVIL